MTPRCGTCRFAEPVVVDASPGRNDAGPTLQCRRYPPQLIVTESPITEVFEDVSQCWPQMADDAWCGEWAPATGNEP